MRKGPMHVLIIEDNHDDRAELRRMLLQGSDERYVFAEAHTGQAALACIASAAGRMPDCILLDYYLPDMEAPAVLAALRGPDNAAACPVVVLTAAAEYSLGPLLLRAGAQDYLGKEHLTSNALTRAIANAIERWTMAREIMDRERELRTIADNTPDILTRFDRAYRHVFVNAAVERATGHPAGHFIGRTNRELGMPAHLCDLWEAATEAVFVSGQAQSIEFSYVHESIQRYYAARLVPEFGADGAVNHVLGVSHDITERKQMEKALLDEDRRKDVFLATLAHELRNPLAAISAGLDLLNLTRDDAASADRTRAMMQRQFAHMLRLVDDLLDISRISSGKIELRLAPVTVQSIIAHALESSQALIGQLGHQLDVDVPEQSLWVNGDLTRLGQVLANLLNNAAKYTPNGGRITLSARIEGRQVAIRITDNGVGIPADMQDRIFDLFAQVEGTPCNAKGGLGIGLSLARKLVDMHGGTIVCESGGDGHGSAFTTRLAIVAPPPVGVEADTRPALPTTAAVSAQRVLIVDDNVDAATALALTLQINGFQTVTAQDGHEGLQAFRLFAPDVVILDIGLPGMSGYEVARHIRNESQTPTPFLVALTGWGSVDDKQRASDAGFDMHLTKPVELAALIGLLQQADQAQGRLA